MPYYRVWYRTNEQPLEFTSASFIRDDEIVQRILEHEKIAAPDILPVASGAEPLPPETLKQLIDSNQLGPVRYVVDASEVLTIT
jgi:uncharacterized Fe-S cluster-containing radical SAM superfamily protein